MRYLVGALLGVALLCASRLFPRGTPEPRLRVSASPEAAPEPPVPAPTSRRVVELAGRLAVSQETASAVLDAVQSARGRRDAVLAGSDPARPLALFEGNAESRAAAVYRIQKELRACLEGILSAEELQSLRTLCADPIDLN